MESSDWKGAFLNESAVKSDCYLMNSSASQSISCLKNTVFYKYLKESKLTVTDLFEILPIFPHLTFPRRSLSRLQKFGEVSWFAQGHSPSTGLEQRSCKKSELSRRQSGSLTCSTPQTGWVKRLNKYVLKGSTSKCWQKQSVSSFAIGGR